MTGSSLAPAGAAPAHDEAAVLALAGEPVLEDDHRGDDVGALHVADVVALDAQRRLVELEVVLQLLQGEAAQREVSGAGHLVPGEGLLGVAAHRLHEGALVAALRHPNADRGPPHRRQPLGHGVDVGGLDRHEHLAGDAVSLGVAVDLQQEVLDERGQVLALLLDDPAALTADAPAAHVEDLHGRLEVVVGEGEDVGVGRVAQHDGLLLEGLAQGADVVAQSGGLLEVELGRGLAHARLEPLDEDGSCCRP